MATDIQAMDRDDLVIPPPARWGPGEHVGVGGRIWQSFASLKLTVVLFGLAIFIILVGTLAQVRQDMWEVMANYFRAWVCWVEASVFFPKPWFPNLQEAVMRAVIANLMLLAAALGTIPCFARRARHPAWSVAAWCLLALGLATAVQAVVWGMFLFPGGATIGLLMVVNLLAAHGVRFKLQARGPQLAAGLAVIAAGALLTWQVIAAGHNPAGLQAVPALSWAMLWSFCKFAVLLLCLGMLGGSIQVVREIGYRRIEFVLLAAATALTGLLTAWVWLGGDAAYLGDAGMRILWQLIQAQLVALVLLLGCWLTFRKRGGIVLLHAGLGLMMLGEWFVSWYAVEERLIIEEGQSTNYALDIRETELAIVDPAYSPTEDDVVVITGKHLARNAQSGRWIQDEELPLDVRVVQYLKNARLAEPGTVAVNPATAGNGLKVVAVPQRPGAGADMGGEVDLASAYIELRDKASGRALGTYLVSQYLSTQEIPERVQVGDKAYELALRFKRTYKPYTMRLRDVRKDDYLGTSTPRDYSSFVHLIDPRHNVDRDDIRIWMNNPLRYAGETFYQSGYHRDPQTGSEGTTLQVVTNTGWMIPYVACMLVGTGLLAHFGAALLRFVHRRAREGQVGGMPGAAAVSTPAAGRRGEPVARHPRKRPRLGAGLAGRASAGWLVPVMVAALCAGWVLSRSWPRASDPAEFDLVEFGKLPVVYEGRVKPVDTLARNALRKVSDYETYRNQAGERRPAVEWFLDAVARPAESEQHRVFRVYNLDVLQVLGLKPRRGFHYSLADIRGAGGQARAQLKQFDEQVSQARGLEAEDLTFFQRKLLEADGRFRSYTLLLSAFQPIDFAGWLARAGQGGDAPDTEARMEQLRQLMLAASESEAMLQRAEAPLAIPQIAAAGQPGVESDRPWTAYATASNRDFLRRHVLREPPNPALQHWEEILAAYARGDAAAFNRQVQTYRHLLATQTPAHLEPAKVAFESYFHAASPFYLCIVLYIAAFVAAACGWLGWSVGWNRTTCAILLVALLVHTLGLAARIYISGRPPVTNLYSSAVFIGWACVVFGLVLEAVYRLGVGNVVAAVAGAGTLLVATYLGMRGDTFTVLQAVLDTQFWLATHVVCITLGYAVTFVAGLLGIVYIVLGVMTRSLTAQLSRSLARMIYGILCFALLFSFIGTVLGGLWADDSWGRFWGWDPKENGALIIVLWNALILHARWDGMARERGIAVLAVIGNIVTSWSWFGVNELSVGLHSYGFTEGVLLALGTFVATQLAIVALGSLPRGWWVSFRGPAPPGLAGAPG